MRCNAPQLRSCNYFVGPWPPFITGLLYDHPWASCSRQTLVARPWPTTTCTCKYKTQELEVRWLRSKESRLHPYLVASWILALVLVDLSVFVGGVDHWEGVIVHMVWYTTDGVAIVTRLMVPARSSDGWVSGWGHRMSYDAGILIVSWLVILGGVSLILIGRRVFHFCSVESFVFDRCWRTRWRDLWVCIVLVWENLIKGWERNIEIKANAGLNAWSNCIGESIIMDFYAISLLCIHNTYTVQSKVWLFYQPNTETLFTAHYLKIIQPLWLRGESKSHDLTSSLVCLFLPRYSSLQYFFHV